MKRLRDLPPWFWNELVWARKFHVQIQAFFDFSDGFKVPWGFWICFDININRTRAPTMKERCGSSCKIDSSPPP